MGKQRERERERKLKRAYVLDEAVKYNNEDTHTATPTPTHTHTKLVSAGDAPAPKWSIKNYANEFVFVAQDASQPGSPLSFSARTHRMRGN